MVNAVNTGSILSVIASTNTILPWLYLNANRGSKSTPVNHSYAAVLLLIRYLYFDVKVSYSSIVITIFLEKFAFTYFAPFRLNVQ